MIKVQTKETSKTTPHKKKPQFIPWHPLFLPKREKFPNT